MEKREENPFGINQTKRYVSEGAESVLFTPYKVGSSGSVDLVDYMGGDGTVERVATLGHGKQIFEENPDTEGFIQYLSTNGIIQPFKSVQVKLSFQAPIEVALVFVYEPSANVNEYSLRYSTALETALIPSLDKLIFELGEEKGRIVYEKLVASRKNSFSEYQKLTGLNMTRELARSSLGINQDTRFFWKMNLADLANFVKKQRLLSLDKERVSDEYVEVVDEIMGKIVPLSWDALMNPRSHSIHLTMPRDNEVVDTPLSVSSFGIGQTRRVTVPNLEAKLFSPVKVLDHGEFQVVDYMGDDDSLAEAARTSYGHGTKTKQDNIGLTKSLIRDAHTTPIEMAELAFEIKAPIFSDPRQAGRHRTLDFSGFMGYTPVGDQFYFPANSEFKYQDRKNRQGRGNEMDAEEKEQAQKILRDIFDTQLETVRELREMNVPEDYIRELKGVGFYTKTWRTGDPHNLIRFLSLRLDKHAQYEVRTFAQEIDSAVKTHTPVAYEAAHNYIIDGMRLSRDQVKFLNEKLMGVFSVTELDELDFFKGHGWIVPVDRDDPSKGKTLSREGQEIKNKLLRLISG